MQNTFDPSHKNGNNHPKFQGLRITVDMRHKYIYIACWKEGSTVKELASITEGTAVRLAQDHNGKAYRVSVPPHEDPHDALMRFEKGEGTCIYG